MEGVRLDLKTAGTTRGHGVTSLKILVASNMAERAANFACYFRCTAERRLSELIGTEDVRLVKLFG